MESTCFLLSFSFSHPAYFVLLSEKSGARVNVRYLSKQCRKLSMCERSCSKSTSLRNMVAEDFWMSSAAHDQLGVYQSLLNGVVCLACRSSALRERISTAKPCLLFVWVRPKSEQRRDHSACWAYNYLSVLWPTHHIRDTLFSSNDEELEAMPGVFEIYLESFHAWFKSKYLVLKLSIRQPKMTLIQSWLRLRKSIWWFIGVHSRVHDPLTIYSKSPPQCCFAP